MSLRWLMGDPIDADLPISGGERFFILQEAKLDAAFDWRVWLWTLGILVPFAAMFVPGLKLAARGEPWLGGAMIAMAVIIVLGCGMAISRRVYAPHEAP